MNFNQKLKQWQALINQSLDQVLPVAEARPTRLHKAMHHSMQAVATAAAHSRTGRA